MIGQLVARRYRVTRQIAMGGMGVVCEAIHEETGRRVALKIIREVGALGEEKSVWVTRFRREARAVAALDSPHIIQVLDAGTDDATSEPFIAMELLTGSDLARLLKRVGPLPPTVALKIACQASRALEQAHSAGVIHRDIKPGNVFLAESKRDEVTVKLVDFGIAKVVSEEITGPELTELTSTGTLLGTPLYMSPEQAKGLKKIDHRADLWALAVVLYKALCDRVPHPKGEGLGQLIVAICTEPSPPVQSHAPWVPHELAAILDQALQLDIDRRFQTASAFRQALEEALGGELTLERDELRALTDQEKAVVARRHTSVFPPAERRSWSSVRRGEAGREDASLRTDVDRVAETVAARPTGAEESRTQPGMVHTAARTDPRPRRKRWAVAAAAGLTIIAAGAFAWVRINRPAVSDRGGGALPVKSMPSHESAGSEKSTISVRVEIAPDDAKVEVDGKPVTVSDRKIAIQGELGSIHEVKLSRDGRETSAEIAITQNGAVPSKLALEPATSTQAGSGTPASKVPKGQKPAAVATAKPAPAPAAKPAEAPVTKPPAAKPGVGVVSDFE